VALRGSQQLDQLDQLVRAAAGVDRWAIANARTTEKDIRLTWQAIEQAIS